MTLPGYYRPAKMWDALIIHEQRLLAVLEFKSQVGSFGNNFNNHTEEAIGSASDLVAASTHGAFHPSNHMTRANPTVAPDPRPPFTGYLMLLEECDESQKPVSGALPQYAMFPEFEGTSYAQRYRIMCEKLVKQGLYSSAALVLSSRAIEGEHAAFGYRSLTEATSAQNLFAELAGRLSAAAETSRRKN